MQFMGSIMPTPVQKQLYITGLHLEMKSDSDIRTLSMQLVVCCSIYLCCTIPNECIIRQSRCFDSVMLDKLEVATCEHKSYFNEIIHIRGSPCQVGYDCTKFSNVEDTLMNMIFPYLICQDSSTCEE